MRRRRVLGGLVLASLAACAGPGTPPEAPLAAPRSAITSPTRSPATPAATVAPTAPTAPTARRTAAVAPTCPSVPDVGSATQVVLVVAAGSSATVRACRRDGDRWLSVLGVMRGHVGFRGVAPRGAKREGDLRTPSGTFPLSRGFGVRADPGAWMPWTRVDRRDVWVDDPTSSLYNTWQRTPADGRWDSAESLYQPVDYAYAQVVDYNTARVPGRGSAIFLHVDDGNPTLGCITVPTADLLRVFRWERPGVVIVIR